MTAQQLAAQQAQVIQAAVNAGGQQNAAHRNPFWGAQGLGAGGGMPHPMMGGLPANFYPNMQAAAAAQENNTAMVAIARLGNCSDNAEGNSPLVVRSSVRKFNVTGGLLSVAQWTRKCVEENLEWLVKLSKRHHGINCVLLAYGDGCETMVLMDDHANKMPTDFRRILKIGVGVSMVEADFKGDESKLAKQGVLQPSDSIWEHLRFEQLDSSKDKKEKCLFIHTSVQIWSDSVEGRRRVLQLKTGAPKNPLLAKCYVPNSAFEQQVMGAWKMAQGGAAGQPFTAAEDETVISFNPKELILLEKAFDNLLTATDLKADASKYTETDAIKCQSIIKRANAEFVMIGPPRKRRKKADKPKVEADVAVKEEADAKPKAISKSPSKSPSKKSASSKKSKAVKTEEAKKVEEKVKEEETEESEVDSDDQPIRHLKEAEQNKAAKSAEKSPARSSRRSSKSSTPKAKTPKAKTPKSEEDSSSNKRGRSRGNRNKSKEDEKRSASKNRKEEHGSKRKRSKK
jgi:hypothetical protein